MAYRVYLHYKLLESTDLVGESSADIPPWEESELNNLSSLDNESGALSIANEHPISCTQLDSDNHTQMKVASTKPVSDNPLKDYIGDFF